MGKFRCKNPACTTKGWGSKKIAILIRRYIGDEYNAVVYMQRCKKCNDIGAVVLDQNAYVERVAYRLKKWAGVSMIPPPFGSMKKGLPNKMALCEGCKRGVCRQASDNALV